MTVEKIKILGAVLELCTSYIALSIQPILPDFLVNGPNWQCCLAGSSKTAPRILIFSTAMGAKPSFYMKFIAT
jgi:hypothetical protein